MEQKIFRLAGRIFDRVLTAVFFLVVCIGLYIMLDTWYVYQSAAKDSFARLKPEEVTEETLREISGDVVAWITLDDTTIDYPVCQRENDNKYYLNRDPKGEYSLAGSIFMDFRNDPDFTDRYNLVYGHHMAGGLMFGALDAFADRDYFDAHRTGVLMTRNGDVRFRTVAYLITTTECEEVFNTDTDTDYAEFLNKNAQIYVPEDLTGTILALTTCKDPATTDRMALILALDEKDLPEAADPEG